MFKDTKKKLTSAAETFKRRIVRLRILIFRSYSIDRFLCLCFVDLRAEVFEFVFRIHFDQCLNVGRFADASSLPSNEIK